MERVPDTRSNIDGGCSLQWSSARQTVTTPARPMDNVKVRIALTMWGGKDQMGVEAKVVR